MASSNAGGVSSRKTLSAMSSGGGVANCAPQAGIILSEPLLQSLQECPMVANVAAPAPVLLRFAKPSHFCSIQHGSLQWANEMHLQWANQVGAVLSLCVWDLRPCFQDPALVIILLKLKGGICPGIANSPQLAAQ